MPSGTFSYFAHLLFSVTVWLGLGKDGFGLNACCHCAKRMCVSELLSYDKTNM